MKIDIQPPGAALSPPRRLARDVFIFRQLFSRRRHFFPRGLVLDIDRQEERVDGCGLIWIGMRSSFLGQMARPVFGRAVKNQFLGLK
jgi:hypothetical protein